MKKVLFGVLSFATMMAIDWTVTAVGVKAIAMCFGADVSLLAATGIWLCIVLVKYHFPKKKKKEDDE